MRDVLVTRRQAIEATGAAFVAAGLCGCKNEARKMIRGPEPTLGWETITSGNDGPGPRSRHGLVYDRNAQATVLFGGIVWGPPARLCSDTWELHDHEWTHIKTSESPPMRHRGAMLYLDNRGKSVLFGGQGRTGEMFGDTWIYSDRNWREALLNVAPSPRCGHCMAFDPRSGCAALFGGIAPGDKPLGDTWVFDGFFWKEITGAAPPARRYAAIAYDPDLKGCLLHGGSEDDHGQRSFGDAWLFRDNTWTRLTKNFDTEPRDDHGMAFHRSANRMVMLEGVHAKRGLLVRDAAGWRPVDANPLHPRHQCSPLAWDESLGGLLLHGGEANHKGPQFDATLLLRMPPAV
jgi:hypothetical protein